ncbi:hypothetical protein [Lapillicoccus jejuensis]|uniref:Uncharacterized protein n=1 Tax=Lapillicoccus jejuensis TaxID=402171 RepID=A0A542DW42_9MICO|nr:hypothetical protein [Lapillicoccus jejuensis]TQJ07124.1 hypothetical protein FB458_0173 [Lapillicoccus jejuensis]
MLFWGWGRGSVHRQVSPDTTVLRTYRYVSLMVVFTVTWGYEYALSTLTPHGWATRPVSAVEARGLLGGQDLQPHWWRRWSLVVGLGAVALLVAFVR